MCIGVLNIYFFNFKTSSFNFVIDWCDLTLTPGNCQSIQAELHLDAYFTALCGIYDNEFYALQMQKLL